MGKTRFSIKKKLTKLFLGGLFYTLISNYYPMLTSMNFTNTKNTKLYLFFCVLRVFVFTISRQG